MKSCEWPGCLRPEDHASLHMGAGGKRFSDEDALEAAATRWADVGTENPAPLSIRAASHRSDEACPLYGDEPWKPETQEGIK